MTLPDPFKGKDVFHWTDENFNSNIDLAVHASSTFWLCIRQFLNPT